MAESSQQLNASRIISYAGSGYAVGGVAATFYLVGRVTHNDRARETGLLGAEALIDSGIVVTVLKEITQRRRPTAAHRSQRFLCRRIFFSIRTQHRGVVAGYGDSQRIPRSPSGADYCLRDCQCSQRGSLHQSQPLSL